MLPLFSLWEVATYLKQLHRSWHVVIFFSDVEKEDDAFLNFFSRAQLDLGSALEVVQITHTLITTTESTSQE